MLLRAMRPYPTHHVLIIVCAALMDLQVFSPLFTIVRQCVCHSNALPAYLQHAIAFFM